MARTASRTGWLFISPAFIHLLVFALFPILYAGFLSLQSGNFIKGEMHYTGLSNYAVTFAEERFRNSLWNSARYAAVSVPFGLLVALLVAVLVNQKLKGITIFRTIYYIPAISSGVAMAMLWIYVYLPDKGMINVVLSWLHINSSTDFLSNVSYAMWALVFMSAWTGLGPRMILFLAGLIGIPPSLYEAAELDGATKSRMFWSVTLPMLAPTTLFVLVTSTISAFQLFTPVYLMTQGKPDDTTNVIGYEIYREAWLQFHVGIASAKSFVLLSAIALVALIQFRLMKRQLEGYSAG